jgi:hypothetical protein
MLVSIVVILHLSVLISILFLIVVYLSVCILPALMMLTLGKRTVWVSSGIIISSDLLMELSGIGVSAHCCRAIVMSSVNVLVDMSAVVWRWHWPPGTIVAGIIAPPVV